MLTGKQVRVRQARERIVPLYLDTRDEAWREVAGGLLGIFRRAEGHTRGELEADVRESFGDDPKQLVHQGLARLLEDRCEFEVVAGAPPEELREAVFAAAARRRRDDTATRRRGDATTRGHGAAGMPTSDKPEILGSEDAVSVAASQFDRAAALQQVAAELKLEVAAVEQGLFADLKSEQRLVRFQDTSADRLLERYNVALAQAVLLRSTGVRVVVRGESPARHRQLFHRLKFHRLVCEIERSGPDGIVLHLDGPLSLFAATQKYGLQLALFLPALLLCRDFELEAELLWGPQRKRKVFRLTPAEGLVSHDADRGSWVPPELGMFVELFRKKVGDWEIHEEAEALALGSGVDAGFWVPDFRLVHVPTRREVYLEVLGFWRRSSAEKHLERLRRFADRPFVLAVSEQLHVDEAELAGLPAGILRFRQMPLPEDVVRQARAVAELE